MIKKLLGILLIICATNVQAQYKFKPDVIVLGASAAGTSAAIQASRSGVKTLLIEQGAYTIGEIYPNMDIAAFNLGFWKEWKTAYKKAVDTSKFATPQTSLENIIKSIKNLDYLKGNEVLSIKKKKNGWKITTIINGKKEQINCKVLVDATTDYKKSLLVKNNIIKLDSAGKFNNLVNYNKPQITEPYAQVQKLYRTSGAAGFGKDSVLYAIPLGIFIPKEIDNLLIASMSAFPDFETENLKNIALWVNIGQAVGALAAYGPFFNSTPSKANIRITQSEMFTYKSFLYPVLDVTIDSPWWHAVQKTIAAGVLTFDFTKGMFHPDNLVKASEIQSILISLNPRSKIWFIENKAENLTIANLISLLSFNSGRDEIAISQEIAADWQTKYKFDTPFVADKPVKRKEFALIIDNYMAPYNVNVDFNGYYLR